MLLGVFRTIKPLCLSALTLSFITLVIAISGVQSQETTAKPPDPADLNNAFKLTGDQVATAIKLGTQEANKHHNPDFLNRVKTAPEWVRGKKGHVHESAVWCYGLDGMLLANIAYYHASHYDSQNTVPDSIKTGCYMKSLTFRVVLNSVPRVARNRFQSNRNADEQDVRVQKFVLSDDEGHNYVAESGSLDGKTSSGTMTFSGRTAVPTFGSSNSTVTAPGGSAYVNSNFTTTQFVPWTVERPYYQATYDIQFNLFNEDGTPRITSSAKRITLHILTENGEQEVVYTLHPPKP